MKAMIFAAGLGTRLRPITDTMPKALVRVGGEPLISHVIRKLSAAGYDDIVVNVHHFPNMIRKYLEENDFGVKVSISDESGLLLETGGGIAHAEPLLGGEDFFVHNVDILSNADLPAMRAQVRPEAISTLVVNSRKTSRYLLFNDQMRLVGWTNRDTGEVRSPYPGIDPDNCRALAFGGMHFMSGRIFDAFREQGMRDRFPIMDFYISACARYPIYGLEQKNLRLIDVGKLSSISEAERFIAESGNL